MRWRVKLNFEHHKSRSKVQKPIWFRGLCTKSIVRYEYSKKCKFNFFFPLYILNSCSPLPLPKKRLWIPWKRLTKGSIRLIISDMLHYFYIFESVHCEITSLWVAFKLFKIKNGFSAKRRSKQIGPWNEFFALLPKYKTTFPVIRADARPVYYSIDFGIVSELSSSLSGT